MTAPIPRPDSDFIDQRTGKISREWYLFLVRPYLTTTSAPSTDDLQTQIELNDAFDLSDLVPPLLLEIGTVETLLWSQDELPPAALENAQLLVPEPDPVPTLNQDSYLLHDDPVPDQQLIDLLAALELEPLPIASRGLFMPGLASSGGGTPTYNIQLGRYTKIDNRIFFTIRVRLATLGTLAAGNVTITGLPYLSETTTNNNNALSIFLAALGATSATQIMAVVGPNATVITLARFAAGVRTILTVADLSGTDDFTISGQYEVNTP